MDTKSNFKVLKTRDNASNDPLEVFNKWFNEAKESEPCDPNAMCLSTIGEDKRPYSRIVLLKHWDDRGFVFYTNTLSRKGRNINHTPYVALNFHWKSLSRQVRITGKASPVSYQEADTYYNSRPRGSRIGAWASLQSQTLDSREILEQRIKDLEDKFEKDDVIPRPTHWSGYRVLVNSIEFWHAGDFRLHTRIRYDKEGSTWQKTMLYP